MSRGQSGAGGFGKGYPIAFKCAKARSTLRSPYDRREHTVVRTGRTKIAPNAGKWHPRKLDRSHEYRWSCGHVGWTTHVDILRASDLSQKPIVD